MIDRMIWNDYSAVSGCINVMVELEILIQHEYILECMVHGKGGSKSDRQEKAMTTMQNDGGRRVPEG